MLLLLPLVAAGANKELEVGFGGSDIVAELESIAKESSATFNKYFSVPCPALKHKCQRSKEKKLMRQELVDNISILTPRRIYRSRNPVTTRAEAQQQAR